MRAYFFSFFLIFFSSCLKRRIMKIIEKTLQLLFPEPCIHCENPNVHHLHLCCCCFAELPQTLRKHSPPELIKNCWGLGSYSGPMGALIRRCKYKPDRNIIEMLSKRIAKASADLPAPDIVTHVPTAFSRIYKRGFDQAHILAQNIAEYKKIEHRTLLKRIDHTPQSSRSTKDRLCDLSARFQAIAPVPPNVLIVDDVLTTGGTLEACAMELLNHGAEQINAIVLCIS